VRGVDSVFLDYSFEVVSSSCASSIFRLPSPQSLELLLQSIEFSSDSVSRSTQMSTSAFYSPDQFIEFEMNCLSVAVLCVLNQKDH